MSSVSTCAHSEFLAFPAGDLVEYVRRSNRQKHYTVCGGVRQVQEQLAKGIGKDNVRVRCRVLSVAPDAQTGRITVSWQAAGVGDATDVREEVFDRVVLAVSPDVVARILRVPALSSAMSSIPTARVESSVLAPGDSSARYSIVMDEEGADAAVCMHQSGSGSDTAQIIKLQTQLSGPWGVSDAKTEALHTMPSGVVVETCPLDEGGNEAKRVLKTAKFTRTLRTVESRWMVETIMGRGTANIGWVNGQDNVWLVGSWCWDGMVLLEGCVVSAMRVADDFGVPIPWDVNN